MCIIFYVSFPSIFSIFLNFFRFVALVNHRHNLALCFIILHLLLSLRQAPTPTPPSLIHKNARSEVKRKWVSCRAWPWGSFFFFLFLFVPSWGCGGGVQVIRTQNYRHDRTTRICHASHFSPVQSVLGFNIDGTPHELGWKNITTPKKSSDKSSPLNINVIRVSCWHTVLKWIVSVRWMK